VGARTTVAPPARSVRRVKSSLPKRGPEVCLVMLASPRIPSAGACAVNGPGMGNMPLIDSFTHLSIVVNHFA
jgi:hypothetical protein